MPFCPHCGSRNADDSRFCVNCGSLLPPVAPKPPVNTPPTPPTYAPPAQPGYTQPTPVQQTYTQPTPVQPTFVPAPKKKKSGLPILLVLLILGILIVGFCIADIVSDGEFNLFGILSEEDDRRRDEDEDDDDDDRDKDRDDRDDDSDPGKIPGILPIPEGPAEATVPTMPAATEATMPVPTEPAVTEPAEELRYYDVTIWVADPLYELTLDQIDAFNQANTAGIYINPYVIGVWESDAASIMLSDVQSGADLYCFPQDQAARLIQAGTLSSLDTDAADWVASNNDAGTVAAASLNGAFYAYPMTADNGYFLYYNKTLFSEEDIDSLEAIIAVCEETGTFFSFDMYNPWYMASFFFATGCESQWAVDADGRFIGVNDTFASDRGVIALQGMQKLLFSACYRSGSMAYELGSGASVVVSGIWDYTSAYEVLGKDLGVADLPSFEVDGVSYHLGSYNGCKLMGVKPQEDAGKEEALHLLAQYLTSEQCQMERFELVGWGPSNLNAQQTEGVQSSPALAALLQQAAYSVPQGQIPGGWWEFATMITNNIAEGMSPEEALEHYRAGIDVILG